MSSLLPSTMRFSPRPQTARPRPSVRLPVPTSAQPRLLRMAFLTTVYGVANGVILGASLGQAGGTLIAGVSLLALGFLMGLGFRTEPTTSIETLIALDREERTT